MRCCCGLGDTVWSIGAKLGRFHRPFNKSSFIQITSANANLTMRTSQFWWWKNASNSTNTFGQYACGPVRRIFKMSKVWRARWSAGAKMEPIKSYQIYRRKSIYRSWIRSRASRPVNRYTKRCRIEHFALEHWTAMDHVMVTLVITHFSFYVLYENWKKKNENNFSFRSKAVDSHCIATTDGHCVVLCRPVYQMPIAGRASSWTTSYSPMFLYSLRGFEVIYRLSQFKNSKLKF